MYYFKMNASVFYPLLDREIELIYNQQVCQKILQLIIENKNNEEDNEEDD